MRWRHPGPSAEAEVCRIASDPGGVRERSKRAEADRKASINISKSIEVSNRYKDEA